MYKNDNTTGNLLDLISIWMQLKNINWDLQHNDYIQQVISTIGSEIDKLHNENDIIMKQNQAILTKLDKLEK